MVVARASIRHGKRNGAGLRAHAADASIARVRRLMAAPRHSGDAAGRRARFRRGRPSARPALEARFDAAGPAALPVGPLLFEAALAPLVLRSPLARRRCP